MDQFYFKLLSGQIPCPWNSKKYEGITSIQSSDLINSLAKFKNLMLNDEIVLDEGLKIKRHTRDYLTLPELIYSVNSLKSLEVEVDYRKEVLVIRKKNRNTEKLLPDYFQK